MTDNEINKAIAEACGWAYLQDREIGNIGWQGPDGVLSDDIPDYLNNLNAIQSAIMSLEWGDSEELNFFLKLSETCDPDGNDPFATACATAKQRCEAFLKTLNLWHDQPKESAK